MKKENLFSARLLLIASIVAIQLMGCENEYVHVSTQAEHKKNLMEIRSLRKSLEMYKKEVLHSNKLVNEAHENLKACLEPKDNFQACLENAGKIFSKSWNIECKNRGLKDNCTLPRNVARAQENYRTKLKNYCNDASSQANDPSIDYD